MIKTANAAAGGRVTGGRASGGRAAHRASLAGARFRAYHVSAETNFRRAFPIRAGSCAQGQTSQVGDRSAAGGGWTHRADAVGLPAAGLSSFRSW